MSDPLHINAGKDALVGTATIAAATDLLTIAAHGLADGDTVTVDTLTGGAVGVLIPDGVYWVRDSTTDTLGLALTPGGALVAFAADGGADVYRWAPQYHAAELRRADAALLYPGAADRFGAREGVRPLAGAPVTLAGDVWTVPDLCAVVYPGLTSLSGPYRVQLPQVSDQLNPPDGTNPRIDVLDLQVQDNDEDASGFRRAHVVYEAGTPAVGPVAPALTPNSLRLAEIPVPASGGGPATLVVVAPFTVAAGGILPVRTAAELPGVGQQPEGAYADQADTDQLLRWSGSAWQPIGSSPGGFAAYTPVLTGVGTATFSTLTGRWKRIAPLTVVMIVYFVVGAAGSGASTLTVTAPTAINRATRQMMPFAAEGMAGGGGGNRDGHLVGLTGGTGAVWDRIRITDGVDSHLDNMTGAMLAAGMFGTAQGVYQEEE